VTTIAKVAGQSPATFRRPSQSCLAIWDQGKCCSCCGSLHHEYADCPKLKAGSTEHGVPAIRAIVTTATLHEVRLLKMDAEMKVRAQRVRGR
jgi:hypothetical protein